MQPPAGTGNLQLPGMINNSLLQGSYLEQLQNFGPGGSSKFIEVYTPKAIGLLFIFGSISFFFMLLWGAVGWILSGGDKASLESAKNKITNAVIGFILLIATFGIVNLIELFFGIDILLIDIGPLVIQ